jgi:RNA polymerase sigma-70 factor (ECF subfamily)
MGQATDETLVADFLGGSEAAFEQLVRRYEGPLLSFLSRYVGDAQEAEEVFQEAFIRVYTKAERFDAQKKFKTWLYTIALNLARTAFKRRRSSPLLARENESGGTQDKVVLEGQAPAEYSPDRRYETMELAELVKNALSSLPQRQREVFVLFQYQGLNYAEIAAVLRRPLGTIKSQMHYAVLALREKLRDAHPQE